jgi:hypothetical protein
LLNHSMLRLLEHGRQFPFETYRSRLPHTIHGLSEVFIVPRTFIFWLARVGYAGHLNLLRFLCNIQLAVFQ